MPVFEVTDPSGRKFRVEGPPGSTAEQALAQVQNQAPQQPPAPAANPDSLQMRTPEGADAGDIQVLKPFPARPTGAGGDPTAVAGMTGRSTEGLAAPRPEQGDFAAGVNAGVSNLEGTLYGLAGLVGESVGSEGLRDWGLKGYQGKNEEAARVGPRIQNLDQIQNLGDFFDAAAGWIGGSTAFLATTALGGGVGGLVGRTVARRAVTRLAEKGIEKGLAEKAVESALRSPQAQQQILGAIKRGALVGSGVSSALSQQGDLFGQLKEVGVDDAAAVAWGFGAVQGALDVIPEAMVLKKLLPGQVQEELQKSLLRGIAGTVAKQAVTEGVTEGAQQSLSSLARITSGGAKWDDKDTQDLLTNMAAGAVVGSVLGGGVELASRVAQKPGKGAAAEPSSAPASDESVDMNFDKTQPAFDLSADLEARTKDWSQMPVEQANDLAPADKLDYMKWINREAPAETRQAYEQKFANGPPTEYEMEDLRNATIVGKNGSVEDSANARGSISGRAEPWASISRAEENALSWGRADLDADYFARRINAPEGDRLGLRPGVYVFAVPKVSAETVSTRTGGSRTRGQAARAGIARAREKWDRLPRDIKEQNQVAGAPKYGVQFTRTDEKGNVTDVMFDSREVTRIGMEVEPDLQTVKNTGERLSRAFWAGMSQIMDTEVSGVRYTPARTTKDNKTTISGNIVLQEHKNGAQITLGQARRAYAAASNEGTSSAVSPGKEMADRDAEIARDKPNADVPRSADLRPATYLDARTGERKNIQPARGSRAVLENPGESADERPDKNLTPAIEDTPVAERGQQGTEAEAQGVRAPTGETEEKQNLRSRVAMDSAPPLSAPGPQIDSWLQGAVTELGNLLGLKNGIVLHRDLGEYTKALTDLGFTTHADSMAVRIADAARTGVEIKALMQTLPDGSTFIYVRKALPPSALIKFISHEVGHAFFRQHWNNALPETRAAVKDEYNRQRQAYIARTPAIGKLNEARVFEEWMADQLAGWVAKHRAPQSVFEKYLQTVLDGFKKIWDLIAKHYPVAPSFEKFVAEATASAGVHNTEFDAIGPHSEPYADESTSLGDKRLSDHVALFREKHPKVDAVMDTTAKSGVAAWDTVLSSLQGRIRRMKIPGFDAILKHFDLRPGEKGGHTFYTEADTRMQQFMHQYEKVTKGLTKEETNALHQEMLLERGTDHLQGKLKERATQLRQLFNRLYLYQRNSHLPLRTVENYFPAVGDKEQLGMADAVDTIDQALTANGVEHTREAVVELVGSLMDDAFANNYDPAVLGDVDANSRSPFVQALRSRVLDSKWRDAIRSVKDKDGNARFYAKDMSEVMYRYINQAVRRSEYNKRLGDITWDTNQAEVSETGEPRKFDPHYQLKGNITSARESGATADQQAFMYDAISAFMGTHGRIKSEAARKMVNGMMAYQNLRTMSLVLLSSFPDLANLFVRTGNLTDTWKSVTSGWKDAWKATEERDSLLRMVGHAQDVGDQTLLASMQSWWDNPKSTSSKLNNAFFRAVGMHRWSAFTKALGARVAIDYINRHAQSKSPDSIARLEELGITATDVAAWNEGKQFGYGMPGWTEEDQQMGTAQYSSPAQLEAVKRVTGALSRIVNEVHVNAKPPEKTLWGNSETMKLLFHLKSFMYGFASRILSRVWYDISKEGSTSADKAAAIAGLAMTLPLAALGLELKDWLQNELWGRPSGLKDKSGWKYMELVLNRSGALGIATMGLDVGDAASGGRAPLVALAGPTISQLNDTLQYGLYHSVSGAVPVLSSFPGWRDSVKEALTTDE